MASRSERRQNSGENDVGDESPSPAATLTDEMRRASKDIHDTSDRLVNMKLGLVLTSSGLYGEALALFYPIFAKIEDIIELHKGHEQIGKIYPLLELMRRAPGFRKDMEYYLTSDRRTELDQMVQSGENSVMEDFLQHLDRISKEDPSSSHLGLHLSRICWHPRGRPNHQAGCAEGPWAVQGFG